MDRESLEWLKDGDFLLLKMSYEKAVKENQKSFKIHVSGFEGSPEYRQHIIQFANNNGLSYQNDGIYIKFHIPE